MTVFAAVLWFAGGAAVEVLNTLTRKWTVERLGRQPVVGWMVGGYVLRLALTSAVLVLGFRHGAISGVAALLGYLCSRWAMVWWVQRRFGERGNRDASPT
jgi:hypothetical protein